MTVFISRVQLLCQALLILLLSTAVFTNTHAQVYPVQATTQLIAPYSLYLSDYTSAASDRLVFTAFLNDMSHPDISVRFKLHIEGQGIILDTKAEFIPAPMTLQSGVPLRLVSADLAQYFEPQNLNFQGMTRHEYEQRGKLPEGIYQFGIEVLEYHRGVKISNTGTAMAWMILNDPPIINLPRQQDKLKPINPQNVVFQWTPRHTGSPNSAFTTEYELTIVEVWPGDRNPNDAILTSPPIYQNTTQSTTVIYGPAETPLELGRRYAFRVKAKSIVGVDELDLFKNSGYSEVYTFVYGDACMAPNEVVATPGSNKLSLQWTGQANHTAFNVQYREQGTQNWYTTQTTLPEASIYSLKPNTVYEYEIAGTCGFFDGIYTDVATVKTQQEQALSYSCGAPMDNITIDPSTLVGSLKAGDVVKAGDFDVEITKVTGGSGNFSGEGIIPLSYFKKAKAKVEFTDIKVNKDLRLVDGFMNVTGAGVDIVPAGVLNLVDKLDQGLAIVDSALSLVESMIPDDVPNPASFVADTLVHINGDILAVVKNPITGNVTVTTTTGQVKELPPGTSYAVTDSKGKGYMVDKNGNVGKTTSDLATKTAKREYNLAVAFERGMTTKLGFDKRLKDGPYKDVPGYEVIDGNYDVAWKALVSGQPDGVRAIVSKTAPDRNKIRFELNGQPISAPSYVGDSTNLSLLGSIAGDQQDLIAIVDAPDTTKKAQVLGKLRTITYDPIAKNLVVIPVNGTKYPGDMGRLFSELNKIYAQAGVTWNQKSYTDNSGNLTVPLDATFDDGNSGITSNYTGDMKKVINAFGAPFDPDTYYLFLVNKPASGKTLGYMPRSKQAGFIFVDMHGGNEVALITTIAHELGHGAFTLKHTFDPDDLNIPQGNTKDNLMDYTGATGRKLIKGQWDRIHMPVTVLGLFEDDAAGALTVPKGIVLNSNTTFLTPIGSLITLPAKAEIFYACDASNYFERGVLLSFKVDNVMYFANADSPNPLSLNFINYISEKGTYPTIDNNAIQIASSNEIFLVNQDPEVLKTFKVDLVKGKASKAIAFKSDFSSRVMSSADRDNLNITEESTPVKTQVFTPCSDNSGRVVFVGEVSKLPTESIVNKFDAYAKSNLNEWLAKRNSKTHLFISKCNSKKLIHFSASGKEIVDDPATFDSYKSKYNDGTFDGESAIWACYDGEKWNADSKYKDGTLNPTNTKIKGELSGIEAAIEERIKAIENTGIGREGLTVNAGEDGEIKQEKLDFFQLIITVRDVAKDVVNNAKVPEHFWNSKDKLTEYNQAGIHIPALLSGAGDQTLDELTSSVQFVSFALDIATEPKIVVNAWDKIKKLKTEDIKKLVIGAASDKYEKYAQGGVIARHEGGKDGVQLAMVVFGAVKKLGEKAKDVVDNADEITDLSKKFDLDDGVVKNYSEIIDETGNGKILKAVNEGDLTPEDIGELINESVDELVPSNKKLPPEVIESFIKGKKYENKIGGKIDRLDDDYYQRAAQQIGMDVEDLKSMTKVKQLQINLPNGNYFIADNAWVKKVTSADGKKTVYELIINETKLSAGTDWTKRQKEFKKALGNVESKFSSRSVREEVSSLIPQNAELSIKSVIRTSGNGDASDIFSIEKIF